MIAVIAEKPSVAREIAVLLGATEKKDGFLSGNGYCVTWALGHLVGLGMPEDYGITGFHENSLPILPDPFLLTPRKATKEKSRSQDKGGIKQLEIIGNIVKQCESIIVATDAGREGELIFRYIYQYLECGKPFRRLWISSLTEKAIRRGLENLMPGSDFDALYHAAQARSQADWLVGINASQALSIAAGNGNYSLGRVQTPTLALICRRFQDAAGFNAHSYWQVQLEFTKAFIDFKCVSTQRWDDEKLASQCLKSVQRSGEATVITVDAKTVTEQPPLLFDLTGLQKEANQKLGLSAEEILGIAQSLYEKRFITYPRTGSRYIPEDLWAEIPGLVQSLEDRACCKAALTRLKLGKLNKRIMNELKVTDHHGLLITGKIPSALSAKEDAVYDLIALRLLEAVSEPCIKQVTEVSLEVLHYGFALRGCRIEEPGWRGIKGDFSQEGDLMIMELPELATGDILKIKDVWLNKGCTKAPALYTEATLLAAMEGAGKELEDQQERQAIHGLGIGTPATRAAIIETLFHREYIRREKKSLVPTEKGLAAFELVRDKMISDAAMTAQWELALQRIEKKEIAAEYFHKDIEAFTTAITKELLATAVSKTRHPDLGCPKCRKATLLIKDRLAKCPDAACGWVQFRNICGCSIGIDDLALLVTKGRTGLIKGMQSKSGKKFDAYITLNDKAESSFEFENMDHKKK